LIKAAYKRMTQYHFLDDSGDPGLSGAAGSSSHFVLAMVQLAERAPLAELAAVRNAFHLPEQFELKYYRTKPRHRTLFFQVIRAIPFRVRAVVINKASLSQRFAEMGGQDMTLEFVAHLSLRAEPLDLAGDVLVIDDATPSFIRALRVRLSTESRTMRRVRPFMKIVGGRSNREDGLQLADMIAGALRHHYVGDPEDYFPLFKDKVVDMWKVL
jgi:hypothetical protein